MARPELLQKVIDYLRTGYPNGVPEHDYMPLFALLGMHLTQDEVEAVADQVANGSRPTPEAIRAAILEHTNSKALDADVARVQSHLAAGGWPLAPVEDLS